MIIKFILSRRILMGSVLDVKPGSGQTSKRKVKKNISSAIFSQQISGKHSESK